MEIIEQMDTASTLMIEYKEKASSSGHSINFCVREVKLYICTPFVEKKKGLVQRRKEDGCKVKLSKE